MLSRKLQKYPFKNYEQFLKLRHQLQGYGNPNVTRIGGSDCGVMIGRDFYRGKLELFHQMIKDTPPKHQYNQYTWKGTVLEKVSVDSWWRYMDPNNPTMEATLENINNKRFVRSYREANFTYVNPEFPWFAINLDYMTKRHGGRPEGVLEAKNVSSQSTDKWESGVAPSYMYQIAAQIHTSGHKIGELFQLKDAVTPEIHEFTKDMTSGLFNQLVEATEEFTSRVTFVKQQKAKGIQGEELEALITEYEPEADSLESTHQFLKERFKDLPENIPMEGDVDTYEMARDYLKYGQTKREANEEQALIKNKLMQIMVNAKTKVIDFGEAGRVSNHSKFSVSKRLAND